MDDGEETQANIYQALFNVMDRHPGVLNGIFFWDTTIADQKEWAALSTQIRDIPFRDKLAEDLVREYYAAAPREDQNPLKLYSTPTPFPAEESYIIYDDAIGADWDLWTWEAEVDPGAGNVVHSGSSAIEVKLDAYGSIGFFNPHDISKYSYLEFYINGDQGGQSLEINIVGGNNDTTVGHSYLCKFISSTTLPPYDWHLVRLSLENFDLTNKPISININHAGEKKPSVPPFYLDDIRLVAAGP